MPSVAGMSTWALAILLYKNFFTVLILIFSRYTVVIVWSLTWVLFTSWAPAARTEQCDRGSGASAGSPSTHVSHSPRTDQLSPGLQHLMCGQCWVVENMNYWMIERNVVESVILWYLQLPGSVTLFTVNPPVSGVSDTTARWLRLRRVCSPHSDLFHLHNKIQ